MGKFYVVTIFLNVMNTEFKRMKSKNTCSTSLENQCTILRNLPRKNSVSILIWSSIHFVPFQLKEKECNDSNNDENVNVSRNNNNI